MKGRRRARRLALQALYELDQTRHPAEQVLEARFEEFYRASAEGALDQAEHTLATQLIDLHMSTGFAQLTAAEVAQALERDPDGVARVLAELQSLQPHVDYAARLVHGVMANREMLDTVIARLAPEWPVEQLAPVDRNILRMALWEIGEGEAPLRVAINEAVDLARLFSGESARRMVNGALGAFAGGDVALKLQPAG
jgi:N utilization substance protein B